MAALPNSNISTSLVATTLQTSTQLNNTVLVTEEVIDGSRW